MQICAPGSWMMHTFTGSLGHYNAWELHVSVLLRERWCAETLHWGTKLFSQSSGDQNSCPGSIMRPLFIRFINVLVWVSARPTEAPAVRIWVKESEFTLYEAARARQPQHQAASSQQPWAMIVLYCNLLLGILASSLHTTVTIITIHFS